MAVKINCNECIKYTGAEPSEMHEMISLFTTTLSIVRKKVHEVYRENIFLSAVGIEQFRKETIGNRRYCFAL
jgi:hypothetical protein